MLKIKCFIIECEYEIVDLDVVIVVFLLIVYSNVYLFNNVFVVKIEKDKWFFIFVVGSSDEWLYFILRWFEYVSVIKIVGCDKVD